MIGLQEALLLLVVVLALAFFVAPFVGIRRATKRLKTRERSTGAVVLASIGAGVMAVAGVSGRMNWFYCLLAGVLNLAWLWSAISVNRNADRHASRSGMMATNSP